MNWQVALMGRLDQGLRNREWWGLWQMEKALNTLKPMCVSLPDTQTCTHSGSTQNHATFFQHSSLGMEVIMLKR